MVPKRTTVAAAIAVAVGVLTLRSVRKRRAEAQKPDPVVELRTEAMEASDHASAALSHARAAAEHGVEYGRQEYQARNENEEEPEQTRLVAGRFR